MKFLFPLLLALLLCSCAGQKYGPSVIPPGLDAGQTGLEFLPKEADRGYVFRHYQPNGRSKWRNNWAGNMDFTGVAWNDSRMATLVSPQHVVMAAHYIRPREVPMIFHDRGGKPHVRFLVGEVKRIPSVDVAVGKLNEPLPSGVTWYRMVQASDVKPGQPVIVSHEKATVSIHNIQSIHNTMIGYSWIKGLNPVYGRNLIRGDSGHPTFLRKNGSLLLVGTHTTGGPGAGPFYGSPEIQAGVRAAIRELGN